MPYIHFPTDSEAPQLPPLPHGDACDCAACLISPPAVPAWKVAPKPGMLHRFLEALAGVDSALARLSPADEQRQISRVGAAVLFGVGLQALMVFTSAVVILGTSAGGLAGAATMTAVICGVLYSYDTLFVSADWVAKGADYAAEYGIACAGGKPVKRLLGIVGRWAMSFTIASTLGVFVLIRLFAADIQTQWDADNRAANAAIIEATTARHERVLTDLQTRLRRSDARLDALATERSHLLERPEGARKVGQQEAELVERLRRLDAAKAAAEAQEAEYRTSATAELGGAKLRAGNTGQQGDGPIRKMYTALAEQQAAIVRAQADATANATKELAQLRTQHAQAEERQAHDVAEGIAKTDQDITAETTARTALAHELQETEAGREAWVTAQVRSNPNYVPVQRGLLAEVQTLWLLAHSHAGLASLIWSLEISIIFLETAGMLTKAFFTQCRVYSLRAALRADDAGRAEADRREGWAAWREQRRQRRDEVLEPLLAGRERRTRAHKGRQMANNLWEQMAARATHEDVG